MSDQTSIASQSYGARTFDDRAILRRPRICQRLLTAAEYPVTVIVAPAGFGKTTAINQVLNENAASFLVRIPYAASLAQFVREFSRESSRIFPAMATPPEDLPTDDDQSEIFGIYLAWMLKHLADAKATIAIDDIQHGEPDAYIVPFIVRLVDETKATVKWILSSRTRGMLPVTRWQAYGESDAPVSADELRMTLEEATLLAAALQSPASGDQLRTWTEQTHGFVVSLTYAIRLSARQGTVENILDPTRTLTFDYLAEQLWSTLSKEDRQLIEVASFAPSAHIHSLESIETPNAAIRLARLSEDIAFLKLSPDGSFVMHDLFRDFVCQRLMIAGAADMRARQISAARAMASSKMCEDAVRLAIKANALDEMLEIIEASDFFTDPDLTRSIVIACERYDLRKFGAGMLALQTEYWGWLGDAERSLTFASEIINRHDAQSNHVLLAIRQQYRIVNSKSEADQRKWLDDSFALLDRLNSADRVQAQSYRASIQARCLDTHLEAQQLLNEIAGYFSHMPSNGKLGAEIAAANAYWWMAKLELAITYARSAVATAKSVGSLREMARAINNLGLMLLSVRNPEVAELFEQLREFVESTGSWRFSHISHWVPATYYALKGDSTFARAGRDLQLGIHPIEKGERTRFASFRRHSINLGNLLDERYGDVIRDNTSSSDGEFESDQQYNLSIDAAAAYYFTDETQSAQQMLRNSRKIHKKLTPIQSHAVLESHLLEIVLLGAVGNWLQARRLFEPLVGNIAGLELVEGALRKYCTGPPFENLERSLQVAYGSPFVGLIAKMIQRAVARNAPNSVEFMLSSTELEVLRQISLGKSNKEIALTRSRSIETIKRQIAGVFRKLGVDSRTRALVVAKERGLL